MQFGGEGLSFRTDAPDSSVGYDITVARLGEDFELPSVLNIGISYDFYFSEEIMLRGMTNFTSNAFSTDQLGVGLELGYKDLVMLRGGYKADIGTVADRVENLYTGISAGISVDVPLKRAENRLVGIDYAYRATNPFRGTHNFSVRIGF